MSVVFDLREVSFAYPYANTVLDQVTFQISAGESVAILGANGCGKSTLLKLLVGLVVCDSGRVLAFGDELNAKSLHDDIFSYNYHQKIGFIFQDSDVQLFCDSVREELAFGLLQLNLAKAEILQRIEDITKLLSIENLLDKVPFKLSGGEKKKVAIAAVLLLNPEVIILDEPTNSLDPKTTQWIISLLQQLHLAGKTLIITTHNLDLVGKLSERGILFNEDHRIVADKTINELLADEQMLRDVNLV